MLYLAVSIMWGPVCGCPYNKSPTIGAVLGSLNLETLT